jgi:tol-pal system protein YbgF
MRQLTLTAALAAAFLLASPQAQALFSDDEARKAILELRQRVEANRVAAEAANAQLAQQLGAQLAATNKLLEAANQDNATLKRSILELGNQNEALRAEIARLRGQGEQLARDLSETQRKQRDSQTAIDDRIRKMEPVTVSVDGREFSADPSEKRDFDAALGVFRTGDFAAAEKSFADFNRKHAASGYLPSALFWLGNAQYGTRNYAGALTSFRELVRLAPDHPRVPEAQLGMANCHIELKDNRSARTVLTELSTKFPQTEAGATAKERLARLPR